MYTCYMHTQTAYGINAVTTRYAHFDAITCNSHDPCCLSFTSATCSAAALSTILSHT